MVAALCRAQAALSMKYNTPPTTALRARAHLNFLEEQAGRMNTTAAPPAPDLASARGARASASTEPVHQALAGLAA